jgi:outer membrane protein assembly factor BamB
MNRFAAVFAFTIALAALAHAGNWPAWRGPTGQGLCDEKMLLKWSDKDNVKWKIDLENQGNSTPVVWGDKVFLTQANKGGSVRGLLCFDRADGKKLWQKDITYDKKERNWNPSWYCNASPATDGERIVVCHGSAGVYCYDFKGELLWKRTDLGAWEHAFGNGASPVLYGGLCIQWCGPNEKGKNSLVAMNKKTGKTVWEKEQDAGSWSTPVIVKVGDRDQLILGHSRDIKGAADEKTSYLRGFDPKDGTELWKCQGLNSYVYTSALFADGIAVAMSGYNGAAIAVKLGGEGDITRDRLWRHPRNIQRVGSGVLIGSHVYIVEENGVPHCYDVKTGEEKWGVKRAPAGVTWGSMVHADGRLYVLMRDGRTLVFKASPKYELLATNSLGKGEQSNSSLAISNGDIFIRTFKHLYCIGVGKKK